MTWRGTPPAPRAFLGLAVAICGVRLLLIEQYCLIIAVAAAVPLHALLRTWLDPDTLRVVATWFSRGVVVVETAMAGVAFIPARVASTVSIAVPLGMWLSTGDLYDAAGPIIGTALAARILAAAARPEIAGRRER